MFYLVSVEIFKLHGIGLDICLLLCMYTYLKCAAIYYVHFYCFQGKCREHNSVLALIQSQDVSDWIDNKLKGHDGKCINTLQ